MSGAPGAIRTTRVPDEASTRVKRAPSFPSRSQTHTVGAASRVAFPGLLRAPFVAWHVRDRGVDDPASPELEEEKHEDRAEPDVVGLHEVTRPRDVIPQERRPALAVASRS